MHLNKVRFSEMLSISWNDCGEFIAGPIKVFGAITSKTDAPIYKRAIHNVYYTCLGELSDRSSLATYRSSLNVARSVSYMWINSSDSVKSRYRTFSGVSKTNI